MRSPKISREECPDQSLGVRRVDDELAAVMWLASFLFLILLGLLLHLSGGDLTSRPAMVCMRTMAIVYCAFPLELLIQVIGGGKIRRQHLLALLLPPLRLSTWAHQQQPNVWFPVWGWTPVTKDLERRLHDWFSVPMMCLALIVLPLIICELIWAESIVSSRNVFLSFQISMAHLERVCLRVCDHDVGGLKSKKIPAEKLD
ncbi:MAG: hypothetical protein R3C03_02335 [Pirellulaceae bacterium]